MKKLLHALAMCQSMFCALPCPWRVWDEKARDHMLLFLPLIGLEQGALWVLLFELCRHFALPMTVRGLALALLPCFFTGFLHLDGFMDVTDAVRSWRALERRREILKDSHVGSFSVIAVVSVLLAQFAFFCAVPEETHIGILLLLPAVSRCASALAIRLLPPMASSQYASRTVSLPLLIVPAALVLLFLAAGFCFWGRYALCLPACLLGYGLALWRACASLKGMNGDIAGYALCLGELCGIAVLALL